MTPLSNFRRIAAGLLVVSSACGPPAAEFDADTRAEVTSQIQQRLDDYAASVTAKDLDGILSFWSDSLVFAGDGAILGGYDEWAPIATQDNVTTDHWIHWTWDEVHVLPLSHDAGSATVEFSYEKVLLTGDTVSGYGSWTYVLKRGSRGWQVYQGNGHHPVR